MCSFKMCLHLWEEILGELQIFMARRLKCQQESDRHWLLKNELLTDADLYSGEQVKSVNVLYKL